MDLGLKGRVAMVTGSASGIGQETAIALAEEGASLALVDRNTEGLKGTADRLASLGIKTRSYGCDVTDIESCRQAADAVARDFGGLHVLCNVAGILKGGQLESSIPADWKAEIDVCLLGTINMSSAALPHLKKEKHGKIVNIASDAGRIGEKSMVAYSAAKGGVISFTRAFAKECGRYWLNVNVICPGTIKTPMTSFLTPDTEAQWAKLYPLRRLGEPRDVAAAIVFLASRQADWITGQTLSVDGGFATV